MKKRALQTKLLNLMIPALLANGAFASVSSSRRVSKAVVVQQEQAAEGVKVSRKSSTANPFSAFSHDRSMRQVDTASSSPRTATLEFLRSQGLLEDEAERRSRLSGDITNDMDEEVRKKFAQLYCDSPTYGCYEVASTFSCIVLQNGTIVPSCGGGNTAPTDISLDLNSISQSATGPGAVIGNLETADADGGDTHTYSLVSNGASGSGSCGASGDDDNASFQVDNANDHLETAGGVAAGTYNVCVQTHDGTDSFQKTFSITVTAALNSSPTLTFTVNSADITGDDVATDGEGGSITIDDIDIQVFNISNADGTATGFLAWKDHSFLASGDNTFTALTYDDGDNGGSKGMAIKSADGSEFKLDQFVYYNWGEAASFTNTMVGYRDDEQVASITFDGFDEDYNPLTIIPGGGFSNVDEVRFYISAGGFVGDQSYSNHSINHIQVSSPNPNTLPALANLDGDSVAWAGVGNTVTLDSGGDASASDTELDALNGGNGDYAGASLTVQRDGGAVTHDTFGFELSGALFTVSGGNLQSGGNTFATFTNSNGVLTINFTSSATTATTALVTDVTQRITYRNDTPYGDATVRFALSDGIGVTTADVTVASNTIHVDVANDTDVEGDAADGFSLREAVARANAQVGNQTIVLGAALAGQTITLGSVLTISDAVTVDADAASGFVLVGSSIAIDAPLTIHNGEGDTLTIASGTLLTGSGALTKTGAGTFSVYAQNSTHNGTLTVNGGIFQTPDQDYGIPKGNATVTLDGGTLSFNSNPTVTNALVLGAGGGTITGGAPQAFSGVISGSGGLTKAGGATLTLSGVNTYTGATSVVGGTLSTASDSNLGSGALTLAAGTTFMITGTTTIDNAIALAGNATVNTSANATLSGVISGASSLSKTGASELTLSGSNTYSGTTIVSAGTLSVVSDSNLGSGALTLAGDSTLNVAGATNIDNPIALAGNATISNSANTTLSGVISGANTLTKSGASTLTLSATNTYADTTVSSGTLSVAGDSNIGSGTVTLNGGVLFVTGTGVTIDNAISLGASHGTVSNANAVTLSGVISGTGNLTKTGAGMLTLSAPNTFTGSTLVLAGETYVNGPLAGALSIGDGAFAAVANSVSDLVTVSSGGILATSGSPAVVALGNGLTVNAGGTLIARIVGDSAGSGYDQYDVTGPVTLGGALSLTGTYTPAGGDSFVIINNDAVDAVDSAFDGLTEGSSIAFGGFPLTVSYIGGSGNDVTLGVVPPTVTDDNIAISGATGADGAYKIGDTVTVAWDDTAVTGDNNGDIAAVTVDFTALGGGAAVAATNSGGTWTATYTIVAGAIDATDLNITVTATDNAGISTTTTDTTNATVDNIAPTVTDDHIDISGASGTDGAYIVGDTVTASWNNTGAGDNNSDSISAVAMDFSAFSGPTAAPASNNAGVWSASYSLTSGLDDTSLNISVTATDDAGNSTSGIDTSNATVDTTTPTGHSVSFNDSVYNASEAGAVSFTFAAAEVGASYSYSIASSGGGSPVTGSGTVAAATEQISDVDVSALPDGTLTLSVTLTDPAGNSASAVTDTATLDASPPSGQSVSFDDTTLNATEAGATGFTFAGAEVGATYSYSITSSGGGTPVSGSGTFASTTEQLTGVDVSGLNDGTLTLSVVTTDNAGNEAPAITANAALDQTVPTVAITSGAADPVNSAFTATVTFSETVSGFAVGDISAGNASLSQFTDNGGGSYSVTVTPTADGSVTLDVAAGAAQDAAGNNNTAAAGFSVAYDGTAPAPTITTSASNPTNAAFVANLDFGEAVSGFVVGDIAVTNATLSGFTDNGNGSYNVTVTPTADGTVTLDLAAGVAQDNAGNDNVAASQLSLVYDTAVPEAVITSSEPDPTNSSSFAVAIAFGEAVSGFVVGDIAVTNATLSGFTDNGSGDYSVTVTPSADGTVSLTVPAGAAQDAAANDNLAASFSVLYDGTAPTLSASNPADNATNVPFDTDVVLTFSEAVEAGTGNLTLFNASDDSVVEAFAIAGVTLDNNTLTVNLTDTLTPTKSYYVQLDGTALQDAAGNLYAGIGDNTTLNFTVTNVAPTAVDDTATVNEDQSVDILVLANDTDTDSALNHASVTVLTAPTNGTTSVDTGSGAITYTPNADFNGSDGFTYAVEDVYSAVSNEATVTITVNPVNDAPVAVADSVTTPEDNAISIDVAANDTDRDAGDSVDPSTITIVSGAANGTVSVVNGKVLYEPDLDFNGSDSFTYTIDDQNGATSNVATVLINVTGVNDLPVVVDDTASVDEDGAVDIGVLANDSDVDGTLNASSVSILSPPDNGTTTVDALTGVVTYTPNANYHGTDSFIYSVADDAGGSATGTVTVTVNSINDAPVANADSATLPEDSALTINVLGNDSDIDGTLVPASVTVVTAAEQGTTTVNATTGAIVYTPAENFNGDDSFTYRMQDNEGAWSNPALVTITVTSVNDLPLANNDSATTDEDTPVTLDLLSNDSDVDGVLNPASVVLTQPANGSVVDNGDGTVTYSPAENFFGTDSFTYTVADDEGGVSNSATVTLTVDPVNDAPVIGGTPASNVDQDSPYSFVPEASDVDPNTTLTFSIDNQPDWMSFNTDTGALTGTPGNAHVGEYSGIVIRVSDGVTSSTLPAFAITVVNVNDPPVLEGTPVVTVNQDGSYSFAPEASDVDAGDELTFSVTNLPAWASFDTATGAITGMPGNSDVGTYHDVTISASDGTTTTEFDSFDITVENVNDPPLIAGDSYTLEEGATLQPAAATGVLANDVDIDGDVLQAELVSNPRNATAFTLNADGSFTYQHNGSETRTDSFAYRITDGEFISDPATVSLTITPVNDPPRFVTEPELVVLEGQTYDYDVGVTDPDSVLELNLVEGPDWLSLSGGNLSGTAPLNATGTVAVVLRASDEEYTVDQAFDLVVQEQQASVVTISTSWSGLPSIVDNTVDLQITLSHSQGPAVPYAALQVTLAGLDISATMANCTGSVADGFNCASGLSVGDSRRFRLRLTPQQAGNLVVNLSLDEAGEQVAAAITDVSVSPRAVSQGDAKFNIANATALASINLLQDGTRELVAGTALGDTAKLLNYSLSATGASVIGEIDNRGHTERVRVVDVDRDGLEDIVLVNRNGAASAIYYDRGGVFEPEPGSLTLPHAREAVLRDLNDDGFPELILGASGFNVYIYENNGGVFDIEPLVFESPASIVHFALLRRLPASAPMSGTLVISSRSAVQLVRFGLNPDGGVLGKPGDGAQPPAQVNQKFTVLRELPLSGVSSLQLADVNGDGREEIIASTTHQNNSADNSGVAVIAIGDDEQLQTVARLGAASANKVEVADFNGDGVADLLVGNANNSYQFYRGTGDASNWTLTDTVLYHRSTLVLPEDVNDDGLADVLVYEDGDEQVQLYLSAADGDLGAQADLVLAAQTETVRKDRIHFRYTLTVSNAVAGDVDAVKITLPIPSQIGVVQLPEVCTEDKDINEVHCQLETLNSGEEWTVAITLAGNTNINQVTLMPSVSSAAGELQDSNNRVSTPLTGMFEQNRARVKGGGSIHLGLLVFLVCLLGMGARRKKLSTQAMRKAASVVLMLGAGTVFSAAMAPASVQAQSAADFYGEFSAKAVSGDWDAPAFFWDSLNSTQRHAIRERKSSRFGWQLLIGHEIHSHWAVEAGYLDAGETELDMQVFYSDAEAVRNLLTEHAPISGAGPYVGMRLSTTDRGAERFYAKLGLWRWSADYTLAIGDESNRFKADGTDWVLGAGFAVPVHKTLSLGGSLQTVGLDDERLLILGVDVVYKF